jgi:hypothetical protein
MKTTGISLNRGELLRAALVDLGGLALILFVPSFAHLLNFPVYMLEPMRVVLILAMAHTTKRNAYLLALTLPAFSWLVSGHPEALKMAVITLELIANVFLFYLIAEKTRRIFIAALSSVIISKIFCYLLYMVLFSWSFVVAEADPLFLAVQAVTTLLFSGYLYVTSLKK